jgi:hypothetical protein
MNQLIIWAPLDKVLICQVCITKWKLKTTLKTIFVVVVYYMSFSFGDLWLNDYFHDCEQIIMKN